MQGADLLLWVSLGTWTGVLFGLGALEGLFWGPIEILANWALSCLVYLAFSVGLDPGSTAEERRRVLGFQSSILGLGAVTGRLLGLYLTNHGYLPQ